MLELRSWTKRGFGEFLRKLVFKAKGVPKALKNESVSSGDLKQQTSSKWVEIFQSETRHPKLYNDINFANFGCVG